MLRPTMDNRTEKLVGSIILNVNLVSLEVVGHIVNVCLRPKEDIHRPSDPRRTIQKVTWIEIHRFRIRRIIKSIILTEGGDEEEQSEKEEKESHEGLAPPEVPANINHDQHLGKSINL